MSKVIYHTNPKEEADDVDFGEWLLKRWPVGSVRPQGLLIFKNDENITQSWVNNEELIKDPEATYHIYEVPRGGALSIVGKIISTILNPILKLFTPNVSASASLKNSRSASSNNSLQGRTNASRPGERISDIRGKVLAYPDLLMDYRIFVDRTEYEVQFLCLGVGEYDIVDVRDGITPVANISGEKLDFFKNGTSPGFGLPYMNIGGHIDIATFPIMIAKPSNEADGSEVKPPNYADVSKATFKIYSTGEIDTTINSSTGTTIDWAERAPVGSNVTLTQFYSFTPNTLPVGTYTRNDLSGTYTVLSSGENILIVNTTGHPGWSALSSSGQNAYLEAYQRTDGYWEFTNSGGSTKFTFTPSVDSSTPYVVGPYLLDSADKVMVNLYAQNGIYKTDGDVYPFTVNFEVLLSDPNGLQPNVTYPMNVTGRFTEAVGSTLIVDNPYDGSVNVSVRRTSNTDKDFKGSVVDNIKWRDLYAISDISPRSYGDITLIHSVTKATNAALKQKERKLNMVATRIHNGIASSNFADVVMSMHTDPVFGRRNIDTIDQDALYAVQQQLLDYFVDLRAIQVGYTFDNNSTTYEEGLQTICNTVNVTPYQVGSILYFWPELPQVQSAMQFGHAYKVPDTDKRTRTFAPPKEYTGVQVKYFDHDAKSYLYVTRGEETNLNKIDLVACQSKYLATIRADREMNKLRYQRVTHETTANSIGLQATPGMRVDMIDNTRMKQHEGVIVDVDGLTLTLSDPVTMVSGNTYSISLTGRLGTIENIPVSPGDDEFTVILQSAPSEEIYTGWLQDRTAYVIRTDDERSKLAMLVQSMEPSGKDNNYQVGLTCINYDTRYYQDDRSTPPIAKNIAIFGDSTVDGYGTTPWVQNPLIPNHYHNTEAPYAWASMLDGINDKLVFNNGYAGQSIIDGWAINNIDTYVFNNITNINLKYVFIAFGLNDFGKPNWSTILYTNMYTELINKVKNQGLTPVVMTSDPLSNINENFVQETLIPLQKSIAESNSVLCFDINAGLYAWSDYRVNQIDGIHFNNIGNAKKRELAISFINTNMS